MSCLTPESASRSHCGPAPTRTTLYPQLPSRRIDADGISVHDQTFQDATRKDILHLALNDPSERPCPIGPVISCSCIVSLRPAAR